MLAMVGVVSYSTFAEDTVTQAEDTIQGTDQSAAGKVDTVTVYGRALSL